MSVAREGYPFAMAGLFLAGIAWVALLTTESSIYLPLACLFTGGSVFVLWFFRNPTPSIPSDEALVVAPGQGRIIRIDSVDEPSFVGGMAHKISIFLSVFDVHVQRAPVSGTVGHKVYRPGKYAVAWADKASDDNEMCSLGIETENGRVLVRQIAGLVARRIITDPEIGDPVSRGNRFGLIRFGSRVDLFLPEHWSVDCEVGDKVRVGSTVLATQKATAPVAEEGVTAVNKRPRPRLQRGVIILPSAFTLGNLFFGIYAIVSASRGDFMWAGWCIVFAGSLDMLDGSVARFTRTGSRFGAELDSLVDAISFGVAPGYILFELFWADTQWSWILAFVYVTAVVVRLARFNIEQGGEAKRHFHGLPSPAAGMTLATWYPFSQTALFGAPFLADVPWEQAVSIGTVLVAVLLVSHVPYAKFPKIGLRTRKGIANTVFVLVALFVALRFPRYYFFLVGLWYIAWGLVKSVLLGLLDRIPGGDPLLDEDEDDEDGRAEVRSLEYSDFGPILHIEPEESREDQA